MLKIYVAKAEQLSTDLWKVTLKAEEEGKIPQSCDFEVSEHQLAFLNMLRKAG